MLEFERETPRESSLPCVSKTFQVLGMKDSFSKIWREHIVGGKAGIVESRPISVNWSAGRVLNNHRLRYCVGDLPKLAFVLAQFLLSLLQGFDVSAHPVPHRDLPGFVAEWFEVDEKPAKDSVMAAHARFDLTRFSGD